MKTRQQQFIDAYEKHSESLYRFCFFKLNDKELAKDLLQETFTKAWVYISKDEKVINIKAFLYKILSNLIIDEYRKRKPIDSLETLKETGFDPSFDDTSSWVDKMDGAQAVELLKDIPDSYRDVLFMRFIEELSLSEIGSITGESENAIAVRIHRGLNKLRALYKENSKGMSS
ncbi:MAG TPA: RNA polymerase sigma factor [Candidatus Paceibacterota bacterium]